MKISQTHPNLDEFVKFPLILLQFAQLSQNRNLTKFEANLSKFEVIWSKFVQISIFFSWVVIKILEVNRGFFINMKKKHNLLFLPFVFVLKSNTHMFQETNLMIFFHQTWNNSSFDCSWALEINSTSMKKKYLWINK